MRLRLGINGLHAKIGEHGFKGFCNIRCRHCASVKNSLGRLIHHDDHCHIGILGRSVAHTGADIHLGSRGSRSLFLGGSRLGGNAIACHICVFSTAGTRNALRKDGTQCLCRLLADDRSCHLSLVLINNIAFVVGHTLHKIGSHKTSAVCYCRHRANVLDRRDCKVLTERVNGKIKLRHLGADNTHAFTGKIDARLFPITEKLEIIGKGLNTKRLPQCHEPHIAGMLNALGKGQASVSRTLVTVDALTQHDFGAATENRAIYNRKLFLQRHGRSNDLKGRTGNISLGQRLV